MEYSPLRFLDNDVSIMLSDEVRNSQEQKSRYFHEKNFHDSIDMNKEYHYELSNIFDNYISKIWEYYWNNFYMNVKVSNDTVKERIKLYEEELELYNNCTKLQRCGYN